MTDKTKAANLTIRKAMFGDLEKIHSLDHRLFPPGICFDTGTFYFHLVDPKSSILVAEADFEFAGFLIYRPVTSKTGTIITIDVEPGMQGRGVGSKLMEAADQLAELNSFTTIVLQVSANNDGALRFYKNLGYTKTRLLKGYYQGKEDAWEMKRKVARVARPHRVG